MRILIALLTLLPGAALAEAVESPALPVYTSEAELWYALASVGMILMLVAAGWLVSRR